MLSRLRMLAGLLPTFVRVRWGLRFRRREDLLAWQARRLRHFLRRDLARVPFYAGLERGALQDLPQTDKGTLLQGFERFNAHGVGWQAALDVALRAERERDFRPVLPGGLTVGLSSGTSGRRGLFLVSAHERGVWAGAMLARLLSAASLRQLLNPFAPPLAVAFFLRADSNLYATLRSRRLRFEYFDLLQPLAAQLPRLQALAPRVLVAPASVLRALAQAQMRGAFAIRPAQVVSVAEVLEAADEQAVAAAWGVPTAQVYQCTEGFLAATCAHGRLHLNEEFVHVEPQWLDAARTRFQPVITDFSRRSQAFVRYRLDDVLRPDPRPCPCGRVSLRLAAVEGRCDDVLWLPGEKSGRFDGGRAAAIPSPAKRERGRGEGRGEPGRHRGGPLPSPLPLSRCRGRGEADAVAGGSQDEPEGGALRPLFADTLRRAMALAQGEGAGAAFEDYRIEQQGLRWRVRLLDAAGDARQRVAQELQALCAQAGVAVPALDFEPWVADPPGAKRRRIRCLSWPGGREHDAAGEGARAQGMKGTH